ncbi:MAG: 2OG-Fe(II) oxygenase [Pseudomonadota bacterium]|nr:2OG-Fe(II) oxygenase [Pseudomonadota bacterium]
MLSAAPRPLVYDELPLGAEGAPPAGGAVCRLVANLLDEAESAALVAWADARGFAPTGTAYPATYRDNDRLVVDDADLAAALFARLRPALPGVLVREGATWVLESLNPRLRACRYRDGQAFAVHRDGPWCPDPTRRTWLTVMLYLDDAAGFTGGETRFVDGPAGAGTLTTIVPRRGTAVVFDHAWWHEGRPVTAGTKRVLRTDVLYRRIDDGSGVPTGDGHRGYVWCLTTTPDGSLVSGGRDGRVLSPPVASADPAELRAHPATVTALAWSGGLWSADRRGTIRSPSAEFTAHEGATLALQALPDGRVASAGADGHVRIWRPDGTCARSWHPHDGWVWGLAASPDGALVSVGEDGRVATLGVGCTHRDLGVPLRCVTHADGRVVVGGADGRLYIAAERPRAAHVGAVRAVLGLPDGGLATAGEDGLVRVEDADGVEVLRWRHPDMAVALAAANGGVASASYDGTVRWERMPEVTLSDARGVHAR